VAIRSLSEARGPDVVHSIGVPLPWLERGETIELEVPRNLSCAKCEGGGCDACDRAGALSLRRKQDPVETVQVSLPERPTDADSGASIVLRIPEQGGFSTADGVPRGLMLLRVNAAAEPDPGVRLCPPAALPESTPDGGARRAPKRLVALSAVIALLLMILFLLMLRLSGWL